MFKWFQKKKQPKSQSERQTTGFEVDIRAKELVALGCKMLITEDFKGAMDAFESALRVDGHCVEAWYHRAKILLQGKKYSEALACYVRSLELYPDSVEALCGLGEAIIEFIEADEEPVFMRENRVEILSEAYHCFDRAVKLNSELPRARVGRDLCRNLIKEDSLRLTKPPLFSFHSGGILEKGKRDAVSPFLKPGDYRRKIPAVPAE